MSVSHKPQAGQLKEIFLERSQGKTQCHRWGGAWIMAAKRVLNQPEEVAGLKVTDTGLGRKHWSGGAEEAWRQGGVGFRIQRTASDTAP